jgi:hypothetical protein
MKIFTHLHGGVSLFEFQNKCAAFNIRLEQVRLVIAYARATFDTLRLEQFSVFFFVLPVDWNDYLWYIVYIFQIMILHKILKQWGRNLYS